MIFQSSKSLLLYDSNGFLPALYPHKRTLPFLVKATTIFIYARCFLFWGPGASLNTILFFSRSVRVFSPDNLSPYRGLCSTYLFFSDTLFGDVNPRECSSHKVCHLKRELVPLDSF